MIDAAAARSQCHNESNVNTHWWLEGDHSEVIVVVDVTRPESLSRATDAKQNRYMVTQMNAEREEIRSDWKTNGYHTHVMMSMLRTLYTFSVTFRLLAAL